MNSQLGLIIAAGAIDDCTAHRKILAGLPIEPRVYCADGGLKHAGPLGVEPCLILGDMDSADINLINAYMERGAAFVKYPVDKDFTDTELAAERAALDGCSSILILGALGARIDHTFTNIQLMYKYALRGVRIALADTYGAASALIPGVCMRIARDKPIASLLGYMDESCSEAMYKNPKISILPLGGAVRGARATGLKYPLNADEIEPFYTTGVSNEFTDPIAQITIEEGAALIMICAD